MGYRADSETLSLAQEYRNWCADSGIIPQTGHADGVHKLDEKPHKRKFKCRRCRQPLFYDTNLMQHEPENRYGPNPYGDKCGFGYLVTPMEWMRLHDNEEKILCPSCGDKLGQYIAMGKRCLGGERQACNKLVRPWIHIQKAKVDDCPNLDLFRPNVVAHHTPSITITPTS
ncbi:hypothetical protein L596_030146 [Steinernema carpocapsae]|uniref:protein-tyrosine-phosphatase n=1 Tax=Steinernema carpocapsae TaxID=34508 RepID=A0A4U5LRV4_STECR|nr:hypothetical protein L596_030146 [Steinernema carpocapsae]